MNEITIGRTTFAVRRTGHYGDKIMLEACELPGKSAFCVLMDEPEDLRQLGQFLVTESDRMLRQLRALGENQG